MITKQMIEEAITKVPSTSDDTIGDLYEGQIEAVMDLVNKEKKLVREAFAYAMNKYPGHILALVWMKAALGIDAVDPNAEQIAWAETVIARREASIRGH